MVVQRAGYPEVNDEIPRRCVHPRYFVEVHWSSVGKTAAGHPDVLTENFPLFCHMVVNVGIFQDIVDAEDLRHDGRFDSHVIRFQPGFLRPLATINIQTGYNVGSCP